MNNDIFSNVIAHIDNIEDMEMTIIDAPEFVIKPTGEVAPVETKAKKKATKKVTTPVVEATWVDNDEPATDAPVVDEVAPVVTDEVVAPTKKARGTSLDKAIEIYKADVNRRVYDIVTDVAAAYEVDRAKAYALFTRARRVA
jgi:hypothetical protein